MANPTIESIFGPNWKQALASAPGGMLQANGYVLQGNNDSYFDPMTGASGGSSTPTSYTVWNAADHGKTNALFDVNGGYQGSYNGAENFGAKDLLTGAAVIGAGMLTGGTLSSMAAGGAGAAGAGLSGMDLAADTAGFGGSWAPGMDVAASGTGAMGAGPAGFDLGGGLSMGADGSIVGATPAAGGTLTNAEIASAAGFGGSPAAAPSFLSKLGLPSGGAGGLTGNSLIDAGLKYGAPIVGGLISSNSASKAAKQQADATAAANGQIQANLDRTRADLAPWRATGEAANNKLAQAAGVAGDPNAAGYGSLVKPFTGADVQNEPGYAFGLNEGLRSVGNRAAAAGSYMSGAALKGAARYATDYAGTKYGEAFNRDMQTKNQQYGVLSGMSSQGQNAANMTGNFAANATGQMAGNTTALGNAQGAASIAGGNALTNTINGLASTYSQDQMLQQLMQQNGGNALQSAVTARILGGNAGFGR